VARAGLTHERVVAEAAIIADEVGLPRLTLASVAARVGVAQPSLYKHIDSLDSLHRDLAVLGVRELAREVSRAAAGKARADALRAVADAYRAYATRRPGPYEASLRAPDPGDTEHIAAAADLLGVAEAVLAGYRITGDDLVDATRFLRAALHGFVAIEAAGGMKMPRDNDLSYHRMITALDLAFTAWPSTRAHHAPPGTGSPRRGREA
jgi:AcrR family transcriptional regulator